MTFRFKRDAEAYERKMKGEQEEILSRTKPMPADAYESAIATLQREGFPIERLERTP